MEYVVLGQYRTLEKDTRRRIFFGRGLMCAWKGHVGLAGLCLVYELTLMAYLG